MSPTFAEVTVALIAAAFIFLFVVRITPYIIEMLANFMNRSLNDTPVDPFADPSHDQAEDRAKTRKFNSTADEPRERKPDQRDR